MTRERFWQKPSGWVCSLLALSLGILAAAMLTLREDLRFQSRPLNLAERHIVDQALATWKALGVDSQLADRLSPDQIRAMDDVSFVRPQERGTFGFTNKQGRILLNPELCFAAYYLLGPAPDGGVDEADLVPTLATLYHETLHLILRLPEDRAYLQEWRYVRRLSQLCEGHPRQARLRRELLRWDREMPGRIVETLGPGVLPRLRASL